MAENQQCNWHGVPWKASVEATDLAEEIVGKFADSCIERLLDRYGYLDAVDSKGIAAIKDDLVEVMMGRDAGHLDPEDLDETNCEFAWVETKLNDLLTLCATEQRAAREETGI